MPLVKHKPGTLKKKTVVKYTKSTSGSSVATSGGPLPEVDARSAGDLVALIDQAIAHLGMKVQEIVDVDLEEGGQRSEYDIVTHDRRIRIAPPRRTGGTLAGKPAPKEFDSTEAGRKLVQQMQTAQEGAWTGAELGDHFGLSSATLHKRRSEFRIVWWKDAKNQFHYPKWQFDQAGALVGGVQDVLKSFQSTDQWRVMRYFLAPWHQLGDRRPLDLLRSGQVAKVIVHAQAHAEENSW